MKRIAILFCLIVLAQSANAMIIRVSLDDMVQGSADIVQGRVISRESRWSDDQSNIITETKIAVGESWLGKSSAGKTVTVQTLGGEVGDSGQWVEHQPVFGANEEVVLFLSVDLQGSVSIHNDEQGKFVVGGQYIVGFDLIPHNLSSFRHQVSQLSIKQEGPR